jgi:hypothetical protein
MTDRPRPQPRSTPPPMAKCPACDLWLAEDDFEAQQLHLTEAHPDVVAQRLLESSRWDGWEDT